MLSRLRLLVNTAQTQTQRHRGYHKRESVERECCCTTSCAVLLLLLLLYCCCRCNVCHGCAVAFLCFLGVIPRPAVLPQQLRRS